MFPADLHEQAKRILEAMRRKGLRLVSAESCTGGLIAALLTEIPGASDVFERGFVTYSDAAKSQTIDVAADLIDAKGAVSAEVADAMIGGALKRSEADIAVAVTGVAGPGGGSADKPVGLVYIAAGRRGACPTVQRFTFGDIGRAGIRVHAVREALGMVERTVADET